jgi:hypothetical protein
MPGHGSALGRSTSAKLKGHYGLCYLELGQPHKAVDQLTTA